jgi:hypothetical protein
MGTEQIIKYPRTGIKKYLTFSEIFFIIDSKDPDPEPDP